MEYLHFLEDLLTLLPYWHYKIDRPFQRAQREDRDRMSMETYFCLQMLRLNGAMTMTEIAQCLRIPKQQATRLIGKLYEYQFVNRLFDQRDRRVIKIEITDKALEYIQGDLKAHEEFIMNMNSNLNEKERAAFGQAVQTLLQILPKLD